jgi:hypothetical protein
MNEMILGILRILLCLVWSASGVFLGFYMSSKKPVRDMNSYVRAVLVGFVIWVMATALVFIGLVVNFPTWNGVAIDYYVPYRDLVTQSSLFCIAYLFTFVRNNKEPL